MRTAGLLLSLLLLVSAAWAQGLEPTERRWLQGAWPVIEQARAQGLPLDVVVQPQPAAGLAPMALAFVDGRCKFVLSLRGNPLVQEQLDRIAATLGRDDESLDAALELMAAHEVHGHCQRHLQGRWQATPEGYQDAPPAALAPDLHAGYLAMRATRREEGYADLAGLAWSREHRPAMFERLRAWLRAERSHDLIEGSHHDTLAWLQHGLAGTQASDVAQAWRAVLIDEMR